MNKYEYKVIGGAVDIPCPHNVENDLDIRNYIGSQYCLQCPHCSNDEFHGIEDEDGCGVISCTFNEKKYGINEECYHCAEKYNISGNTHIGCRKYCQGVKFKSHGIRNGWVINLPFLELSCFDPTWKETYCHNFNEKI